MMSFSVWEANRKGSVRRRFQFSVAEGGVLLAGSRHVDLPRSVCLVLAGGLANAGFGFLVGCAPGVDRSFRKVLAERGHAERTLVACAFKSRLHSASARGLTACLAAPEGLSPKAALRRRTLWLVKRCSFAVLFPERPFCNQWGPGSRLVYRSCLDQLKPVFLVSSESPPDSEHYRVARSCLYGLEGFWVVPHPVCEGGPCDDQF